MFKLNCCIFSKTMESVFEDNDNANDARSEVAETQDVTVEQFNDVAKRLDSMESSVGGVLTKV